MLADANPLSLDDRVEAVDSYVNYADKKMTKEQLSDVDVRSIFLMEKRDNNMVAKPHMAAWDVYALVAP